MEDTVRTTMSGDVLRRNEIEERYHDEWAKEIDASGLLVPGFSSRRQRSIINTYWSRSGA